MKRTLLYTSALIFAASLAVTSAAPKDDVIAAAKKLAAQPNYSWKSTTDIGGGQGGRMGGPTDGKTDKSGLTWLSMTRGDNTLIAILDGKKGALKIQDEWKSLADAANEDQGPGRWLGRMLQAFKAPAAQLEEVADKSKDLKKDGDVLAGELTDAGAKSLLTMGARGADIEVSEAKGSVKIWLKDGAPLKWEVKLAGRVSFNGNEREVDRTTTVEIKDVGTTKIEVPEEARKKLG